MSIINFKGNQGKRKKLSLSVALSWVILSVVLISGTTYFTYFYYQHLKNTKKGNSKYNIIAIVQSSQSAELLQSEYLAEQLGLSVDVPINLYSFNTKRGVQKLLRSPLIHSASIQKVTPGTLYLKYSMRKPIAYLGDLSNTATDEEGVLIPFKPFFTPKSLPKIVLGSSFFNTWKEGEFWGNSIESEGFSLAKKIIEFFEVKMCGTLGVIDLKSIRSTSLGKREIILTLNNKSKMYLRLPPEEALERLEDFYYLYSATNILNDLSPKVVDLRLNHQAILH